MADKASSSRGLYILSFFTFLNFAAFVGIAVYHIQYERNITKDRLFSGKDFFKEILKDFETELKKPFQKRDVDAFYPQLRDFIQTQRSGLVEECREEVLRTLAGASHLAETDEHNQRKRQTNTAGNDLANIFGEIAKSEVAILARYCNNGSFVCLPGQKGDSGKQGLKGVPGTAGQKGEKGQTPPPGVKGDTGLPGPKGSKGESGLAGVNGTKGDIGDPGLAGANGTKGDKGDPGLAGVNGTKGEKGDLGLAGANGTKGDKGDSGLAGVNGTKGDKGDLGLAGANGIKGDKGDSGLAGANGTKGDKGDLGLAGVNGTKGDKGDLGLAGANGTKGDKGDLGLAGVNGTKGDKGDPGTDGQTITGPAGPKGQKGDNADTIPIANQCCSRLLAPSFFTQVETISALEGTQITLNCDPTGYPEPAIVWTPEPSTLDPQRATVTKEEVTLTNLQVSDGKVYTCLARNALGTSEKQFLVNVYKHIKFDELPRNYTVMMLKPVTLECKIEGPLSPHINWYKIMPDGSRFLITKGITPIVNGSQLHIDHVSRADVGQYVCEGSNGVETLSKTAFIHTYGPPHIIPPGTVHATDGTNIILKCDTDTYPPSNITWKYPPGVTNAYKESDGTLMVLGAKPKDATYFICIAKNEYGTDQATLQLQVDVPPHVTLTPGKVDLSTGISNIALECKVTGDPPLTVSWAKNGTPLSTDGHYLILSGNVLLINQASGADAGNYTCTAQNSLGSATGTTIVA